MARYLIDGYNLIHALEALPKKLPPHGLQRARERLFDYLKTALGADRYLTFTVCDTAEAAVRDAQAQGYQVIGIELADTAVPLHEVASTDKVCLALGHEDRGLSAATLALCDEVAFIPMLGKIGSLNVATAAAIACYEMRRHSWTAPAPPPGPAAARSHAVGIDLDA